LGREAEDGQAECGMPIVGNKEGERECMGERMWEITRTEKRNSNRFWMEVPCREMEKREGQGRDRLKRLDG
jgi:hypothetical protein